MNLRTLFPVSRSLRYALTAVVILTSCSAMNEDELSPSDNIINVGDPLPTFTITMNDGSSLSTSDLRGKPSLIIFFSTTCPDCQRELPELNRRFLLHGTDTTFVAIGREQTAAAVASYWEEHSFALPYSPQSDRTVYSLFAKKGIPRIYISNASGIVEHISAP